MMVQHYPSCGGVLGRDCFNTGECAEITRAMSEPMRSPVTDAYGVERCSCGSPHCGDYWLTGIGKFVQGSGFTKADAEHIAALLNAFPSPPADHVVGSLRRVG